MTTVTASGSESYVLFELAGATYALRSDDIQQLEMVAAPTPVPNAPEYVDGVVAIRGQVIPAVSLRARFGFPRAPHDVRSRLIIVRSGSRTVALIVDSAREFASIAADDVKPLPEGVGGLSGLYVRGIAQKGDRLMLIVDVAELLTDGAPDQAPNDSTTPTEPRHAAPAGAFNDTRG